MSQARPETSTRPRARIRDRSRAESAPPAEPRRDPFIKLVVRLGWMVAGPAALFVLAASIAQQRGNQWHLDVIYVVVLLLTVAVRYADVRFLDGTTATGEPATTVDVRRYALGLVVASLAAWFVARVVAFIVGT